MIVNRREFLKTLGLLGVSVAVSKLPKTKTLNVVADKLCPSDQIFIRGEDVFVSDSLQSQLESLLKKYYTDDLIKDLLYRENMFLKLAWSENDNVSRLSIPVKIPFKM